MKVYVVGVSGKRPEDIGVGLVVVFRNGVRVREGRSGISLRGGGWGGAG